METALFGCCTNRTMKDKLEYLAKWIAAITAIFVAMSVVWKQLVRAYKYLQESEERREMLQHILDTLDDRNIVNKAIMDKIGLGYFQTDLKGYSTCVGDVVCKILGYPEEDLMGLNWSIKIVRGDRERIMESFEDSIKYKTDFEETYHILCGDGKIKNVHVHARRSPLGYFGILTEIK